MPWMTNAGHQIITNLCALPKGADTERIRDEMRQVIEDERLSDYESIYNNGSLKEEKVGCAVSGLNHRYTEILFATPNNDFQCRNICDLASH
jgi:hypothetical protein